MGFGGGGSSGVTAHTHTSSSGDGGQLDSDSLINGIPIWTMVLSS